jgi:quercetin dioxygenase-like cupin family protein
MKRNSAMLAVCLLGSTLLMAQNSVVANAGNQKFGALPNLPDCTQGAVVDGNPGSGPSVILAKTTGNCTIPMHWHTPNENVTLTSGTARIQMKDGPAQTLHAGSFIHLPSKHPHMFTCNGGCSMYIASDTTFDIHYVDKAGKEISAQQALGKSGNMSASKE